MLTQPQAIRLSLTGFGKAETLRDPGRVLCLISRLLLYTGKSQRGYSSQQQGPSLSFWERPRCGEAICPSALAVAAAAHPSLCAWGSRGASGRDCCLWGQRRGTLLGSCWQADSSPSHHLTGGLTVLPFRPFCLLCLTSGL